MSKVMEVTKTIVTHKAIIALPGNNLFQTDVNFQLKMKPVSSTFYEDDSVGEKLMECNIMGCEISQSHVGIEISLRNNHPSLSTEYQADKINYP